MAFNNKTKTDNSIKLFQLLTDAELEILHAIKKGMTSSEIAKERYCSARTIEKHRSNIIRKLDITSTQNALLVWIMQNLELFNT